MSPPDHRLVSGDMFAAPVQTLTNAVNCRGVMGAGVALEFKKRYPEMFADYEERCRSGLVKLGEPYLWRGPEERCVLNFPTKDDWRLPSRLEPIVSGLEYLVSHCEEWGITSLAVPALGCGRGGLSWENVRPVLIEHLGSLEIPVLIYRPV